MSTKPPPFFRCKQTANELSVGYNEKHMDFVGWLIADTRQSSPLKKRPMYPCCSELR